MDWNKPVINVFSNICYSSFFICFYKLPKDHHCLHEQAGASKVGNTMNEMDNGLI